MHLRDLLFLLYSRTVKFTLIVFDVICNFVDRGYKQMYGLFFPASKKAAIYVVDTVRTNQMPNMTNLFNTEHAAKLVTALPDIGFLVFCIYQI